MAEATKKTKKPAAKTARSKATPPAEPGARCSVEKCKQPVRAKGYCRKHYIGWRRGSVGDKHRYKICTAEGCRKPRVKGSLCEEHSKPKAAAA